MSKFWAHLFVAERVDKQPLSFQFLSYSDRPEIFTLNSLIKKKNSHSSDLTAKMKHCSRERSIVRPLRKYFSRKEKKILSIFFLD